MYYVVQVMSRKEDYLIHLIKERINKDLFIDAFTPKRVRAMKKANGEWMDVLEIVFNGYIFIDTNNIKDMAVALFNIPDFARVLGRDPSTGDFLPLDSEECRFIDLLCDRKTNYTIDISKVEIREGQIVRVLSGPLVGLLGLVKKVNLHKKSALVSTNMLGREVSVLVGIEILKPELK